VENICLQDNSFCVKNPRKRAENVVHCQLVLVHCQTGGSTAAELKVLDECDPTRHLTALSYSFFFFVQTSSFSSVSAGFSLQYHLQVLLHHGLHKCAQLTVSFINTRPSEASHTGGSDTDSISH